MKPTFTNINRAVHYVRTNQLSQGPTRLFDYKDSLPIGRMCQIGQLWCWTEHVKYNGFVKEYNLVRDSVVGIKIEPWAVTATKYTLCLL